MPSTEGSNKYYDESSAGMNVWINSMRMASNPMYNLYSSMSFDSSLPEKPKPTIMKKLSNYVKKMLDADTQALLKAGFINGDLEPTSLCKDELLSLMFFANRADLVARAHEVISESEAENKKF